MKKYRFSLFLFTIILLHCTDSPHVSYGIKKFPNSLDPSFDLEFDESQISSQIYENLINLDNDFRTLIPGLAISWSISEDNLTYTFVLRKNVFFHDGTKLSSYSILSSFKWLRRKPKKSDIYKKIKRVDLIDSLTFQFVLKKPYSIFLHTLASPESFQVISEHAISKYDTLLGRHPVGTGPYELKKWINDDKIVLKRFKKYWGKQSKITEILFKYFHNKFQAEEALRDNIIDILYAPSSYSLDRLKWTGHIDYKTFTPQSILLIGFNNKVYPFNNKLVRKAILQAIDIPKIVHNSSRGNAIVAKGPVPPNFFNYGQMKQGQYNLDKAKSILHQQGINNLDVNFDFPLVALTRIVRIEFLKHELNKIGINLNIRAHSSWDELDSASSSESAQMFYDGGRSDIIGDSYDILYSFFHSNSKFNSFKYHEPLIDNWLDEAIKESNPIKRNALYKRIVTKILDDTPAIFLYHHIPNFAYNSHKIIKLITDPYGVIDFTKIELN